MDFINIYKLSNYIKDKTDALLARYGHVNKLAETLAPSIGIYDAQLSTIPIITVNLNTNAGIIQNVNMNIGSSIKLVNPNIKEDSIIFYNLAPLNTTELSESKSNMVIYKEGNMNMVTFMVNPTLVNRIVGNIHFWIINP